MRRDGFVHPAATIVLDIACRARHSAKRREETSRREIRGAGREHGWRAGVERGRGVRGRAQSEETLLLLRREACGILYCVLRGRPLLPEN